MTRSPIFAEQWKTEQINLEPEEVETEILRRLRQIRERGVFSSCPPLSNLGGCTGRIGSSFGHTSTRKPDTDRNSKIQMR